jgi:phosphoglycolate phosphatase-like HAD superfamily hydrolase
MDLDGTIIDSDITNFQLLYSLLKKYNFEDKLETIMHGLAEGTNYDDIMVNIGMPSNIRKKMDAEMAGLLKKQKYKLLKGVKDALAILKKKGFKLAIATDNYYDTTKNFLRLNKIEKYFNDNLILASDNFAYQKPNQKVIEEILSRSGSQHGILIGNSSKEIDFAKSVDMPILLLDNFSNINSKFDDQFLAYYKKIRQLKKTEDYDKIFEIKTWEEIPGKIRSIFNCNRDIL